MLSLQSVYNLLICFLEHVVIKNLTLSSHFLSSDKSGVFAEYLFFVGFDLKQFQRFYA